MNHPSVAVLTISDRSAKAERKDLGGPATVQAIRRYLGWDCNLTDVVADDNSQITTKLCAWADQGHTQLILTTGGTGFAPRDITPEATRAVIERDTPGLMEAVRAASLKVTPHAMLSRGVAGIRGHSLIINLPGNPKAVREYIEILAPVLPHALEVLADSASAESSHRKTPSQLA